jgi:hypothetical protein
MSDAKQGSGSFLKKRTKKLSLIWVRGGGSSTAKPMTVSHAWCQTYKSFLVLFFKKALLSSSQFLGAID